MDGRVGRRFDGFSYAFKGSHFGWCPLPRAPVQRNGWQMWDVNVGCKAAGDDAVFSAGTLQ